MRHTPEPWTIHLWTCGESGTTSHGTGKDGIAHFSGDAVGQPLLRIVAGTEHLKSSQTFGSFEGCHIAEIPIAYGPEGLAEAKANAKLIAAAPGLFDALNEAPKPGTNDALAWLHNYSQWYHRERAKAIAKATT